MNCTGFSLACLELGDRPIQIPFFLKQSLLLFHLLRELLDTAFPFQFLSCARLGHRLRPWLGWRGHGGDATGNTINGFIPCDSVLPRDNSRRSATIRLGGRLGVRGDLFIRQLKPVDLLGQALETFRFILLQRVLLLLSILLQALQHGSTHDHSIGKKPTTARWRQASAG